MVIEWCHRFSTPGVSTLTFPFHFLFFSHSALAPPDNDHPHMSLLLYWLIITLCVFSVGFFCMELISFSCLWYITMSCINVHPTWTSPHCVCQGLESGASVGNLFCEAQTKQAKLWTTNMNCGYVAKKHADYTRYCGTWEQTTTATIWYNPEKLELTVNNGDNKA